jgi:hypothetical protein
MAKKQATKPASKPQKSAAVRAPKRGEKGANTAFVFGGFVKIPIGSLNVYAMYNHPHI